MPPPCLAQTIPSGGEGSVEVARFQDLTQRSNSSAARGPIVDGYAAEFYAGSRIEFEKVAKAFSSKPGAGDGEALNKLSSAVETSRRPRKSAAADCWSPRPPTMLSDQTDS
jgi:hypothetical protein